MFINYFLYIKVSKIEVRLRGQATDSFSFKQDANDSINKNNPNRVLKADFLTFATLRPISILDPFIQLLNDKHIGLIVGEFGVVLRN